MRNILLALLVPVMLSACGTSSGVWATDEAVARAAVRGDGPPMVTLFTMINNENGEGAHSALMVNASQRVVFNPAGTFNHPRAPQRADTHYGIDDPMVDFFIDYHARTTYHVVRHDVPVTAEQAEMILARIETKGTVPRALCATSINSILRDVPGFESVSRSPFPKRMMRSFDEIPGVTIRRYYDDSPGDRSDIVDGEEVTYVIDSPEARSTIEVRYGPEPR